MHHGNSRGGWYQSQGEDYPNYWPFSDVLTKNTENTVALWNMLKRLFDDFSQEGSIYSEH